jgi:hypothetical protein
VKYIRKIKVLTFEKVFGVWDLHASLRKVARPVFLTGSSAKEAQRMLSLCLWNLIRFHGL